MNILGKLKKTIFIDDYAHHPTEIEKLINVISLYKKKNVCFIQLISPTTSYQRAKKIIKDSHEMIYYISMLSTTGGKLKVSTKEILKNYQKIKRINPNKSYVIGFGITEKNYFESEIC